MNREYYVDYIEKIASKVPMNPNDKFGPFIDVDYEPTSSKANNSRRRSNNRPKDVNFTDVKTGEKIKGDQLKNKFKYMKEDATSFMSNKKKNIGQGPMLNNAKSKMKSILGHLARKYPNALAYSVGAAGVGLAANSMRKTLKKKKENLSTPEVNQMLSSGAILLPNANNRLLLNGRNVQDPLVKQYKKDKDKSGLKKYKYKKNQDLLANSRSEFAPAAKGFGYSIPALAAAGLLSSSANHALKGVGALGDINKLKSHLNKSKRYAAISNQLGKASVPIGLAGMGATSMKLKQLQREHSAKYLESLTPEQRDVLSKKYHMGKKKKEN